jgi:hypothetical protein
MLKSLGSGMKTAFAWIAKKVAGFLVWQLVMWLAGAGIAWMIITLQEDMAKAIKEYNNDILAKIFTVEDILFNLEHKIYLVADRIVWKIQEKIISVLSALLPEQIDAILKLINWSQWADAFFSEMADAAANAVHETTDMVVSPLISAISEVRKKLDAVCANLQTVQQIVTDYEKMANSEVTALYTGIDTAVQTQEDAFNTKITGLFDSIQSTLDVYNTRIDSLFTTIQNMVDWFNEDVQEIRNLHETGQPIIWSRYVYSLSDAGLEMDDYCLQLNNFGINQADYMLIITLPPMTLHFDFSIPLLDDTIRDVTEIHTDVAVIEADITALPADMRAAFASHYPAFLSTNFEERLKQMLIVAITAAMIQKRDEILSYFAEIREELGDEFEAGKKAIINKTLAIRKEIEEAEIAFINKLPSILRPGLLKQVEKIKEQVVKSQDKLLVDIDKFLIDTKTVDRIVQTLSIYAPSEEPIRFDTVEWTLQDIYRILNHYFWRHERMAIAVAIASQDMQIASDDLLGLMADITEYEDASEVPV